MIAHLQEGRNKDESDTDEGHSAGPLQRNEPHGDWARNGTPGKTNHVHESLSERPNPRKRQWDRSKGKAEGCGAGRVTDAWWEDVQTNSKCKTIDTEVASHMIKGGGEQRKMDKKRVCTVRKERCGGSG